MVAVFDHSTAEPPKYRLRVPDLFFRYGILQLTSWHFPSKSVDFLDAMNRKTFMSSSVDPCSTICAVQLNGIPAVLWPDSMRARPLNSWSLCWRCCRFKPTTLTGRLARIPASRSWFLTVCSEILRPPGINEAVEVAVLNRLNAVTWCSGFEQQWWFFVGLTLEGHGLTQAVKTYSKYEKWYIGLH